MLGLTLIVAAATALGYAAAPVSAADPTAAASTEMAWTISTLATGAQPFEVLAADLDGDGHVDLAVTNFRDSTVGVYHGNGDGTFAMPATFPTGDSPRGLVAADFNRDGIVDLAAAATHGGGIEIHLGQGGGRFAPGRLVRTDGRPFHAVTADFNADGIPDIALANEWVNLALAAKKRSAETRSAAQSGGGGAGDRAQPPQPPPPTPDLRISEEVALRFLVRQARPVYPPLAKQARIQGTVRLAVIIDWHGTVVYAQVISGHPLLIPSALEAVKQWEYNPAMFNAAAKYAGTYVSVTYSLQP